MIQDDYQTVLKQLLFIALPHKKFNGYAPCPWLAKGLSTGKVLVERGVDPTADVRKAEQHNNERWATCYWYQKTMTAETLETVCKVMCNDDIEILYMHPKGAPKPMGVKLSGEYPLLVVQNKKLLEQARANLPPDYPFDF